MNPASRAWKDMLGQGSENSAREKGGTRETERLSRNELTFTDLTKKRGTLTYPITDTCDSANPRPLSTFSPYLSPRPVAQSPHPSTSMHAVTASGLDCSFSHPKRLGTPRVGEGNRSREAFRPRSSGIKPVRATVAAVAAAAATVVGEVQAARRGEQFGSKTGQSLISPRRLETSARTQPPLLQGVRCGYRGRTGRRPLDTR